MEQSKISSLKGEYFPLECNSCSLTLNGKLISSTVKSASVPISRLPFCGYNPNLLAGFSEEILIMVDNGTSSLI